MKVKVHIGGAGNATLIERVELGHIVSRCLEFQKEASEIFSRLDASGIETTINFNTPNWGDISAPKHKPLREWRERQKRIVKELGFAFERQKSEDKTNRPIQTMTTIDKLAVELDEDQKKEFLEYVTKSFNKKVINKKKEN